MFNVRDLLHRSERHQECVLGFLDHLPFNAKGPFLSLRLTKRLQKDRARLRPQLTPDGVKLDHIGIRLYLTYQYEDYVDIQAQLASIFKEGMFRRGSMSIADDPQRIRVGGRSIVGMVISKRIERTLTSPYAEFRCELPAEIDRVILELHFVTPSLRAISFDVIFAESLTRNIESIVNSDIVPPLDIRWPTFGRWRFRASAPSREVFTKELIDRYLNNIINNVMNKCVRKISPTLYRSVEQGNASREEVSIYLGAGFLAKDLTTRNLDQNVRSWLFDRGVRSFEIYSNKDGSMAFLPSRISVRDNEKSKSVIVFNKISADDNTIKMYGGEREHAYHQACDMLNKIQQALSVISIVDLFWEKVDSLRRVVYVKRSLLWSFLTGRAFRNVNVVHWAALKIDKLSVEYDESKDRLFLDRRQIKDFIDISLEDRQLSSDLAFVLNQYINRQTSQTKKYINIAKNWQFDQLQAMNVLASASLQVVAVVIALLGLILAIFHGSENALS